MSGPAEQLLAVAEQAAAEGARVALDLFRTDVRVEHKQGLDDLVSRADREAEQAIRAVLSACRPDDAVLGEEGGVTAGTSGLTWVLDPIDGTTSYLYGRADWSVSVAVTAPDGQVLAAVLLEPALGLATRACAEGGTWAEGRRLPDLAQSDLARAVVELNLGRPEQKAKAGPVVAALVQRVRDLRRGGSAAAALANVAAGRADAAWLPGLRPWDCAAGVLLVTEAGGCVGDLRGQTGSRVPPSGDVLAASPALWPELQALIAAGWEDQP